MQLADHPPLLQLVDLDHGVQELEVVAGVGRQLLQRQRVLRKAGAAESDPRAQEARADPAIEADPFRDLNNVRAGGLADVRDLVDERDPGHQSGIGRELDHLGGRDVGAHDRRIDAVVERRDGVPVLVLESSHDDPVRVEKVRDRTALGGEFGIRDVAHLAKATLVEPLSHPQPGADGHCALHHDDAAPVDLWQLVDHCPDGGKVSVARVRRRRADRNVDEVRFRDRLGDVCRERETLRIAPDQLLEPRLVDRDLTSLQRRDPIGEDVADDDGMAELREAGACD